MARSRCIQQLSIAFLVCFLALAPLSTVAQGLPVQFGLLPLGDLTTTDQDGPYAIPDVQSFEVSAQYVISVNLPVGAACQCLATWP